ncbi:hypothetical protein [Buttiauxella agrestis]|uniref:hypothetical protein n=1 Tax=Buttiauxella agrestis TaxID=82977 RepID=UPI00156041EE|nr:hypothetical protein [Buttiauxella agrestis]BCG08760.1 hypothetical protein BADSM9389_14190 [Buttiauxella agrestis]
MRALFLLTALTLTGCHYAPYAAEEATAVNELKATTTTDAAMCHKLGYEGETIVKYGGVQFVPEKEFDIYYARTSYLRTTIKSKVAAGSFTLTPEQCEAEKRKGAADYKREIAPPKKSPWDNVL